MPKTVVALALVLALVPFAPSAPASVPAWTNHEAPGGGPVWGLGGTSLALVASTVGNGAYVSHDNGASWSQIPGFPINEARVAADPNDPSIIYVAGFGGVARTLDAGATWTHVHATHVSYRAAVAPDSRVAVTSVDSDGFAHVLVSDDHGDTWQDLGLPGVRWSGIYGLAFGRTSDEVVLATIGSIHTTHDAGASWSRVDRMTLSVARDATGAIWTMGDNIQRSTDGGATWTVTSAPTIRGWPLGVLPIGLVMPSVNGFLVTNDGATWESIGFAEVAYGVTAIVPDPHDADAFFVSDEFRGVTRLARDADGVWSAKVMTSGLPPIPVRSLASDASGGFILAGTDTGTYASRDGGRTWDHTGTGLGMLPMTAVAVDANGTQLFAGGSNRVFQPIVYSSSDGGQSWRLFLSGGGDGFVGGFAIDPADSKHAFVAITMSLAPSRVLETRDGGATWQMVFHLPGVKVRDIAWDPATNRPIAATDVGVIALEAGVQHTDNGVWTPRSLSTTPVRTVAATEDVAFAGGARASLWRQLPGAPLFTPWTGNTGDARDIAIVAANDAWVATTRGELLHCTGAIGTGVCADDAPPAGDANAVHRLADGRVLAGTSVGLWTRAP